MYKSEIRTYETNEIESIRLNAFATICNQLFANKGYHRVYVKDIYFDYGQNWMYTALITDSGSDHWQSLCPRDYKIIINCDSFEDMVRYADYYVNEIVDGNICVSLYKLDNGGVR